MDLTSGLRSEIFRPIVTIIVPGILAAAPFVFLAAQLYPPIRLFIAESSTLATFLGFTISIGFGLLSQEMGSTIEVWCLERRLKKVRFEDSTEEFYQNWYRYLCTAPGFLDTSLSCGGPD